MSRNLRDAPSDAPMLVWLLVVIAGSALALAVAGPAAVLPVVPTAFLLLEPSFVAERFVRTGRTRAAFWATRLSLVVWRRDRRGGAALNAARADLASGRVPGAPLPDGPVTTGLVTAAALAASGGGDPVGARRLHAAAGWFDAQPERLVTVRREWIAADQAVRGRWDALAAEIPSDTPSPALRLLRAVAERLLDLDDAPDAAALERLAGPFAADPRWAPLLARARGARHRAAFQAPPLPEDALTRGLEVHRRAQLDPSWLDAALCAWDDTEVPPLLRERVITDLTSGFRAAGRLPDPDGGPTTAAVRDRLNGELQDELEAQARALRSRLTAHRDLPPIDEVREFAWFVDRFPVVEATPEGADLLRRRMAFRAIWGPLVDWSSDLYNRRSEPYLFRAVCRWLLAQARLVDDTHAVGVLTHNLAVSRLFG